MDNAASTEPGVDDGRVVARPKPRRRRFVFHDLLKLTLFGLPELDLFDNKVQRDNAVRQIARETTPGTWSWLQGFLLLTAALLAVVFALRILLAWLRWRESIESALLVAGTAAFAFVLLRAMHRRGIRGPLREKLLAAGIPVCRGCGYSLRGQTPDSTCCPECGRPLDEQVGTILTANAVAARPASSFNASR